MISAGGLWLGLLALTPAQTVCAAPTVKAASRSPAATPVAEVPTAPPKVVSPDASKWTLKREIDPLEVLKIAAGGIIALLLQRSLRRQSDSEANILRLLNARLESVEKRIARLGKEVAKLKVGDELSSQMQVQNFVGHFKELGGTVVQVQRALRRAGFAPAATDLGRLLKEMMKYKALLTNHQPEIPVSAELIWQCQQLQDGLDAALTEAWVGVLEQGKPKKEGLFRRMWRRLLWLFRPS